MESVGPIVVFEILGIPITSTVTTTWLLMAVTVFAAILLSRRRPVALEMLVEFLNDTLASVMAVPVHQYLPLLGSLAIFIAVANTINIIPGLSSPTSDINTALALALIVFFSVHYYGIKEKGLLGYFRDLASPVFLLPFEIIGQLSRTLSLTLRLFGNIFSGELIVAIIFAILPLFVPLPLVGMGLLTGLLQAFIFAVLAAVYIATGIESSEMSGENADISNQE